MPFRTHKVRAPQNRREHHYTNVKVKLLLEPDYGATAEGVAQKAADLATAFNMPAVFEFNGAVIEVEPGATSEDAIDAFWNAQHALRDAERRGLPVAGRRRRRR